MEIAVELNLAFYVNVLSNKGILKNISGGGVGAKFRRKIRENLRKMAHFCECSERLADF